MNALGQQSASFVTRFMTWFMFWIILVFPVFQLVVTLFDMATPPHFLPEDAWNSYKDKIVTWDYLLQGALFAFGSVIAGHLNIWFIRKTSRVTLRRLSSSKIWGVSMLHGMVIRQLSRASFVSTSEIDESIRTYYRDAKGAIYLFNPPTELVISDKKDWQDIRAAISDNASKLEGLHLKCSDSDLNVFTKDKIGKALNLPHTKIHIHTYANGDSSLAQYMRFGVYCAKTASSHSTTNNASHPISRVLYRPLCKPYDGHFVLIQDGTSANAMQFLDENGHTGTLYNSIETFLTSMFPDTTTPT